MFRCDDESERCNASDRLDRRKDSSHHMPQSTTISTSVAISSRPQRSVSSAPKPSRQTGENDHIIGLQIVDEGYFYCIEVLTRIGMVEGRVKTGACPAEQHTVIIERAEPGQHGVLHIAKGIEHIGDHARIEL